MSQSSKSGSEQQSVASNYSEEREVVGDYPSTEYYEEDGGYQEGEVVGDYPSAEYYGEEADDEADMENGQPVRGASGSAAAVSQPSENGSAEMNPGTNFNVQRVADMILGDRYRAPVPFLNGIYHGEQYRNDPQIQHFLSMMAGMEPRRTALDIKVSLFKGKAAPRSDDFGGESSDDSLFVPASPRRLGPSGSKKHKTSSGSRMKVRRGKKVESEYRVKTDKSVPTYQSAYKVTKPGKGKGVYGKRRNGHFQGLDNKTNRRIFELRWDVGLTFSRIANIFNQKGVFREHEKGTNRPWTGPAVNNRYNNGLAAYLYERGIPLVPHKDVKAFDKKGLDFDQDWKNLVRALVSQFQLYELPGLIAQRVRAAGQSVDYAEVCDRFERKEQWEMILAKFQKACADRGTRDFRRLTAMDIKCLYARVLNDDWVNNPVQNKGRYMHPEDVNDGMDWSDEEGSEAASERTSGRGEEEEEEYGLEMAREDYGSEDGQEVVRGDFESEYSQGMTGEIKEDMEEEEDIKPSIETDSTDSSETDSIQYPSRKYREALDSGLDMDYYDIMAGMSDDDDVDNEEEEEDSMEVDAEEEEEEEEETDID